MKEFEVVRGRSSIAAQMEAAMAANSASFGMDFASGVRPPAAPKKSGDELVGEGEAAELLSRLQKGGYCNGLSAKELSKMHLALKEVRGKADDEKDASNIVDENGDGDADITQTIDPHGFMNGKHSLKRMEETDTNDDDDGDDSYTEVEDDGEEEYEDDTSETETDTEDEIDLEKDMHDAIVPVSPALEFLRKEGKSINGPPARVVFPTSGQVEGSGEFLLLRSASTLSWNTLKESENPNTAPWPEGESPMTPKAEVQNEEMIDDDEKTIRTEILSPTGEARTASVAMLGLAEVDTRRHGAEITSGKSPRTMSRNNIRVNPKKGLFRAIVRLRKRKNGAKKEATRLEENDASLSPSAARDRRAPNLRQRVRMLGISRRFKKKNAAVPKTNKLGAPKTFARESPTNDSINSIDKTEGEPNMPDKQDAVSPSTPLKESNGDNYNKYLAIVTPVKVRVNDATTTDHKTTSPDRGSSADTPTTTTMAPSPSSWSFSSPCVGVTDQTGNAGSMELNNGRAGNAPPAMPAAEGGGLAACRTHTAPDSMPSHEQGQDETNEETDEATSDVPNDRDIFEMKNSYKLRGALFERQCAIAAETKKEDVARAVPLGQDEPVAAEENSIATEKWSPGIETTKGSTDDTADTTVDGNIVGDGNGDDDMSEPSIRIVCDDCDRGIIGASTNAFVEVSAHGACEDIEVINCMGLGDVEFEIDHIESHRVKERVDGTYEEEEGEQESLPQGRKNTKKIKKIRVSKKATEALVPTPGTDMQQQESCKETLKPPLVKQHTGRGRLSPSKIRDMMNRGNNSENNDQSKSQDPERTKGRSKSAKRSDKKIGGRFRKKKQKAATSIGGVNGDTNKHTENSDEANKVAASTNICTGGSGASVHTKRGLSKEAKRELKFSWLKKTEGSDNVNDSANKGLSSEARRALERAEKEKLKKKKEKNMDEPTRKPAEILVPFVITPVKTPKLYDRKNCRRLSQEAQSALDGDKGIGVDRSRRRGNRGFSHKAKDILAKEGEDNEDSDAALDHIEVSVGLHLPKNCRDSSEDEISLPKKSRSRSRYNRRRRSRSVPRSDESDYTTNSEGDDGADLPEQQREYCRRSRRSRGDRRGRRSRSALRYDESDYSSDSEDGSHSYYESDSEDDSYVSYGSSASRTSYSGYSQSDDESHYENGRDCSRRVSKKASRTQSIFVIPQEELVVEDLNYYFGDTRAHVSTKMKSSLIKSIDALAGGVRGRNYTNADDLTDCAQRGGESPRRKKVVKRSDSRGRPPRLPRSGKGSAAEKKGSRDVGKKKNLTKKKLTKSQKKKNEELDIKEEVDSMDVKMRQQLRPLPSSPSGSDGRHTKKNTAKYKVTKEGTSKKNGKERNSNKKKGKGGKKRGKV